MGTTRLGGVRYFSVTNTPPLTSAFQNILKQPFRPILWPFGVILDSTLLRSIHALCSIGVLCEIYTQSPRS